MEPDTLIYGGDGQMPVAGTIVHDHAKSSWITFTEAMAHSSNVGVIKVALELGKPRMFEYLKAFGFGQKTGIDLSGESAGILREPHEWSGRSLSSLAMGQEIAVTPVQMVTAMSVVANGGWLMTPHVVSSVVDGRGNSVHLNKAKPKRRPISTQTADRLTHILETVVESGTGQASKVERVSGSWQDRNITEDRSGHWRLFIDRVSSHLLWDLCLSSEPRLTMLVVIDDPEGKQWKWGGASAAPVFRECGEPSLASFGHITRWRSINTDSLFLSQFVLPACASAVRVRHEIRGTWRR